MPSRRRPRPAAPQVVADADGFHIKHDSSNSEPDERLLRRLPTQSSRGIKLIPRSALTEEARRLTRQCQIRPAGVFRPQDHFMTPEKHFPLQTIHNRSQFPRFINRFNSREIMLVVDGSCLNNGAGVEGNPPLDKSTEPSAGASFIYKNNPSYITGPHATSMPFVAKQEYASEGAVLGGITIPMPEITGKIALRVEQQGPRGDIQRHTSNRAKLRAVIAALDFRPWSGEGWERVVIVTDLQYVVYGATKWMPLWLTRRWRSAQGRTRDGRYRIGKKIANRDLWEELQSRIDALWANGVDVAFWLVPPKSLIGRDSALLKEAKNAAKEAAKSSPSASAEEYTRLCGVFV